MRCLTAAQRRSPQTGKASGTWRNHGSWHRRVKGPSTWSRCARFRADRRRFGGNCSLSLGVWPTQHKHVCAGRQPVGIALFPAGSERKLDRFKQRRRGVPEAPQPAKSPPHRRAPSFDELRKEQFTQGFRRRPCHFEQARSGGKLARLGAARVNLYEEKVSPDGPGCRAQGLAKLAGCWTLAGRSSKAPSRRSCPAGQPTGQDLDSSDLLRGATATASTPSSTMATTNRAPTPAPYTHTWGDLRQALEKRFRRLPLRRPRARA